MTWFKVCRLFLNGYAVQAAGGQAYQEYWTSAENLDAFNAALVGTIEVTHKFQ